LTRPHDRKYSVDDSVARKTRDGRIFALTLAGGFLCLALVAEWRHAPRVAAVAAVVAVVSLLAATLVPGKLEPIRRAWMKLGESLAYLTTPIVMAIVYYLVVTPIGLLRRARGVGRPTEASSWHRREPLPPRERMERQF
jgi:saxitoxin biosynthesis operon SxtJ-like protein